VIRVHDEAGNVISTHEHVGQSVAQALVFAGDGELMIACGRLQVSGFETLDEQSRNAIEVSSTQWRSTIGRVAVTLIILAVLLFLPAGRIT
jgi:hypothetical protein